jgi:hypothetical protein
MSRRSSRLNALLPAEDRLARERLLMTLASRHRITKLNRAKGRCLVASLQLARAASRRGIAVDLLRWSVRESDDFVDHWAIRLNETLALDLTARQFSADPRLLRPIDSYPAEFGRPNVYPAELFLPAFRYLNLQRDARLPLRFMLNLFARMARHDGTQAWRQRKPGRAIRAMNQATVGILSLCLRACEHWARRRAYVLRDSPEPVHTTY